MRFLSFFLACFVVVGLSFHSTDAEAKKFRSKSIGKSYQTAPKQPTATPSKATKSPAKKSSMKGLLGGLLAGGLLASLFMGGAFEGLQFADIIIIAAVLFGVMWFVRRQKQMAFQQAGGQQQQNLFNPPGFDTANSGSSDSHWGANNEVPFNLPTGFNVDAFLEGSKGHYKTIQQAWNENDLVKIREYVSDEIYAAMAKERAELTVAPQVEVLYLNAQLVRADQQLGQSELSILFTGQYKDHSEAIDEPIHEIWHLEKQGDNWIIVGIENND